MQRAAIVIGINNYTNFPKLHGCVNDSYKIGRLLRHDGAPEDPSVNMQVNLLNDNEGGTTTIAMQHEIYQLFNAQLDLAVLYFSGHGAAGPGREPTIVSADGTPAACQRRSKIRP